MLSVSCGIDVQMSTQWPSVGAGMLARVGVSKPKRLAQRGRNSMSRWGYEADYSDVSKIAETTRTSGCLASLGMVL